MRSRHKRKSPYFNQSTLSDESKDSWLEGVEVESKKIDDKILSDKILLYEKMNDTAYFNQSTLSDESKDESNALLSDSKESEDAIFNESFRFRRGIGKGSTDGSRTPVTHFLVETRMAVSHLSPHLSHITHAMSQTLTESWLNSLK